MENDIYDTYTGKAYRFMTFEGLYKTIEKESLRFTRVGSFNDPLDNSPYLVPCDWAQSKKEGRGYIKQIESHFFTKILSSIYICCFCKEYDRNDSYLMWSHYGKSHSQVCFEIDFSTTSYLGNPSNVKYPKNLRKLRDKPKPEIEKASFIV